MLGVLERRCNYVNALLVIGTFTTATARVMDGYGSNTLILQDHVRSAVVQGQSDLVEALNGEVGIMPVSLHVHI